MTQEEVKYLLKRYSQLKNAIAHKRSTAFFSIGTRKERISIDHEIVKFVEIVGIALEHCVDSLERDAMRRRYEKGESDVFIMTHIGLSKTVYYKLKASFTQRVYECCILQGLVSLEEISGIIS